jgi:hypothetical protein
MGQYTFGQLGAVQRDHDFGIHDTSSFVYQRLEDREQKSNNRGQMTLLRLSGCGRQADDREQRSENRWQRIEIRRSSTEPISESVCIISS